MTLDTHDYVDAMVVHALHTMETLGKEQCCKYVKDVLVGKTESIHTTVKKNQLPRFKRSHSTTTNSQAKQQFQQIMSD